MHRVLLFTPDTFEPDWWANFIHSCGYTGPIDVILTGLLPYHAKFIVDTADPPYGNRYLEFPDEKSYLMFMLKWS